MEGSVRRGGAETRRFRHHAQVVEAMQFDGSSEGAARLAAFAGSGIERSRASRPDVPAAVHLVTTFGFVKLEPRDWVVRTGAGRFAAMNEADFTRQHEVV